VGVKAKLAKRNMGEITSLGNERKGRGAS